MYIYIRKPVDIVDPSAIQQPQRVSPIRSQTESLNRPAAILESHRFESPRGLK